MSNELAKYLNSRRRYRDDNAVLRQVKIAKQHGLGFHDKAIKEPKIIAIPECKACACRCVGSPPISRIVADGGRAKNERVLAYIEATIISGFSDVPCPVWSRPNTADMNVFKHVV